MYINFIFLFILATYFNNIENITNEKSIIICIFVINTKYNHKHNPQFNSIICN